MTPRLSPRLPLGLPPSLPAVLRAAWLKEQGKSRGEYNQIANFVLAQSEINIAIGAADPKDYFKVLAKQVAQAAPRLGAALARRRRALPRRARAAAPA